MGRVIRQRRFSGFASLVGAGANLIEPLKDRVELVRLHHELLEAFHAGFCHVRGASRS